MAMTDEPLPGMPADPDPMPTLPPGVYLLRYHDDRFCGDCLIDRRDAGAGRVGDARRVAWLLGMASASYHLCDQHARLRIEAMP